MRQTPDKMRAFLTFLRKRLNFRSLVVTLAAIVVFTTTYLLILPAFTLEKDEAVKQGGIDVVAEETAAMEAAEDIEADEAEEAETKDQKSDEKADESKDSKQAEKAEKKEATAKKAALQAEGEGFTVSATPDAKANVPDSAELQVAEIQSTDKELKDYRKEALSALKEDSSDVKDIKEIKVYDMSLESDGKAVSTDSKFNVKIEYEEGVKVEDADNVRVLTFDAENKASVLDEEENKVETKVEAAGKKSNVTEASFETEGITKVAVVEVETIEKTVITADGKTYKVTVKYGKDAQIPDGATLDVKELTGDDYDAYLEKTASKLDKNADDLGMAKFFDITIKDGSDEVKIAAPVDVEIKLLDSDNLADSTQVIHFADANNADVVDSTVNGDTVEFKAEGFSIYAIVDKEEETSVARAKIVFQNVDGTEYHFLNNAGNDVDNQVIHTDSVLEEVGMPEIDVSGQTFRGWYIYDIDTNQYTSYQLNFGGNNKWTVTYGDNKTISSSTAVVTSEDADDAGATFYARPYFGDVCYLTFYNESGGEDSSLGGNGIILSRVQVIKDSKFDISELAAVPPDAMWNEETQSYEPVSFVFAGWSELPGTDDDNRDVITDTEVTVTSDKSYYPVFKQGHWVTFYTAPSGTGATYLPAKIVLTSERSSVARPTVTPTWKGHSFVGWFTTPETYDPDNENYRNANGTINTTYNGYLSTNETAAGAYAFNEYLDDDITLYAHWNADTANVTVVKWLQVVSDDKNATTPTREQMSSEGYADDKNLKHYEYGGQQNLTETVNSILRSNDGDITIPTGFERDTVLSDAQVVVTDDGKAVLNLYFDRKTITLNFDRNIETHVKTDATTGTLYGLVDGQYVRVTWNGTNWIYTTTEPVYQDYTGTRYNTTNIRNSNNPQHYGVVNGRSNPVELDRRDNTRWYYDGTQYSWGTRYYGEHYITSNNGAYGFVNGEMVELTEDGKYQSGTQNVEHVYEGDRYIEGTTRSFTGLYGQTLAQNGYEWPSNIGWQYSGYNYSGGRWSGPTTYQMSYLGQFVVPPNRFNGANDTVTSMTFSSHSATNTIYYYIQNEDGTWPNNYIDAGVTTATSIQIAEKFDGFTMDAYQYNNNGNGGNYNPNSWTSVTPGESSKTVNNGMAIRYRRLPFTIKFLDSNDGSELANATGISTNVSNASVNYGASMASAKPADPMEEGSGTGTYVINTASSQYVWDGKWYKDQACTEEFNWNEPMPNHDVAVYAGWKEVWYWVKIDPNGGTLTSTEATWFWESYGGIVEEYHDITRMFVEDDEGLYYYHYDEFDEETELNQYGTNVRKAEYRLKSEYSGDGTWRDDSYDGKSYTPDSENTYSLVGWYKVNDDGTMEAYNFSSPVTGNLTLRALWRVVGEYHVRYSNQGVNEEGEALYSKTDPTQRVIGTINQQDTNKYADKSMSSILKAPDAPSGYTFMGWFYDGHVYNPGDSFIIDADLDVQTDRYPDLDDQEDRTIVIYPVFVATEDIPVVTTYIPFVGNGGTTAKESGEQKDENDNLIMRWVVSDDSTKITYQDYQPNKTFDLSESPTYFSYPGHTFVGWGKRVEGDTTLASNFLAYNNGKFFNMDGKEVLGIAADEFDPHEELYALWQENSYTVTVKKEVVSSSADDQHLPFAFTPVFSATGLPSDYARNFPLIGDDEYSTSYIDDEGHDVTTTYYNTKTFENIPYGSTVKLTEGNAGDFEVNVAGKYTDDNGAEISIDNLENGSTIPINGDTEITFTNTRKITNITIKKTDESNVDLKGAKFEIYNIDGPSPVKVTTFTFDDQVISDGVIDLSAMSSMTIGNVPSGNYRLREIKAPEGYILLDKDIDFTVDAVGEEVITIDAGTEHASIEGNKNDVLIVSNTAGVPLPMTGGIGTTIFYVLGSILVIGCGIILVSRKRIGSKK